MCPLCRWHRSVAFSTQYHLQWKKWQQTYRLPGSSFLLSAELTYHVKCRCCRHIKSPLHTKSLIPSRSTSLRPEAKHPLLLHLPTTRHPNPTEAMVIPRLILRFASSTDCVVIIILIVPLLAAVVVVLRKPSLGPPIRRLRRRRPPMLLVSFILSHLHSINQILPNSWGGSWVGNANN